MTSAPKTQIHEKLSDLTECSICAEIFRNPKLLPCVHTFCLHCLEKYGKDKNPGDQMPCPICRNEFVIPHKGFSDLPNNFFIGKIVEIAKLATASEKDTVCDLCPDEAAVAKRHCIDCGQNLCERCNQSHSRIKHCQNHQVVELGSQLNVKDLNFPSSYCDHHPKERIKMYCYDDNVAVCLICCVESHHGHRCASVDKAAGEFTEQLKADVKKVADRRSECQETSRELEKFKTEFMDEVSKTEESIRNSGIKLKEFIDSQTEILVQNLGSITQQNLKSFEITKQEVVRFSAMIDSYQRYCDELLARGSPVDICRAASQMETRASDLVKQPVNCNVDNFSCEKLSFQPTNLEIRMKKFGVSNVVGILAVAKSADRILKMQKSVSEIDFPANWQTMKNDESFRTTQLTANDQEYKDVARAVFSTALTTINQIVKIERIQNKTLYKQYVVRKTAMDAANPDVENERTLWHGCSADTLDNINKTGFSRSYCGKNVTAYGRVVYFSKNFRYSAQNTHSPPDANGLKHIYQCKVLTGEFVVATQSTILPPPKPGGKTVRYDSTVDSITNPTVFAIYSDMQAYPEYLIYFK